eukprot:scaffold14.g1170.t1
MDSGSDAAAQWERFALAQAARHAPHPHPDGPAPGAVRPACYRVRLCHLDGLPLFQAAAANFELWVGLTLFDEAAGCFFGRTLRGLAVQYEMTKSRGKHGFRVDLDLAAFFHSRAAIAGAAPGAPPALSAVAEVVLVERSEAGVVGGEYSAGWAAVPLSLPCGQESYPPPAPPPSASPTKAAGLATEAGPSGSGALAPAPASPAWPRSSGAHAGAGGAPVLVGPPGCGRPVLHCVPVVVGSPRYLLLRRELPPEHCFAPPPLAAEGAPCRLHYLLEPWPEMEAWAPLVPLDCLVCARDVVPGLQRFAADSGLPTRRCLSVRSQLSPPARQEVLAVQLAGLELSLPDGFIMVARGVLLPAGQAPAQTSAPAPEPPLWRQGSRRLSPAAASALQQGLHVRASVHNGRQFVGLAVVGRVASLEPVAGQPGAHLLAVADNLPLAWLPADDMVAIVLELVFVPCSGSGGGGGSTSPLRGGRAAADAAAGGGTVLAWGAFVPFAQRGRRATLEVEEGPRRVALRSGPGAWVRPAPVLAWRQLLEATSRLSPKAPVAAFRLQHAEGQGIWPPPATADAVSLEVGTCRRPTARQQQQQRAPLEDEGGAAGPSQQPQAWLRQLRTRTESAPDAAGKHAAPLKPLEHLPSEVPTWQISAHYQHAQQEIRQQQAQAQQQHVQQRCETGVQAAGARTDAGAQSPEPAALRLRSGSCPRLVRAWPALESSGAVVQELAAAHAAAGPASPRSTKRGVVQRAACEVRALLQQGGPGGGAPPSPSSEALMVQQRVLSEVEVARERCKRGCILAQLQQQQASVELAEAACQRPEQTGQGRCAWRKGGEPPQDGAPVARTLWRELRDGRPQPQPRQQARSVREAAAGSLDLPPASREFEVAIPPGCTSISKKVRYTNHQAAPVRLAVRTDCPALVRLARPALALGAGEGGHIRITFDAAGLEEEEEREALVVLERQGGTSSDECGGGAALQPGAAVECFRVRVRRGR